MYKPPSCDAKRWGIAQEAESCYWEDRRGNRAYSSKTAVKDSAKMRFGHLLKRTGLHIDFFAEKSVIEIGGGPNPFITAIPTSKQCVCIDPLYNTATYNKFWLNEWIPANCKLVRGVGEQIPFPDKSFDIAISSNSIDHGFDPFRALHEMLRVAPVVVLDVHHRKTYEDRPEHPAVFHSPAEISSFIVSVGGIIREKRVGNGKQFSSIIEHGPRFDSALQFPPLPKAITDYIEGK